MNTSTRAHCPLAYKDEEFIDSEDARTIRIIAEYLEPLRNFRREQVQDTIVFFGSARVSPEGRFGHYYAEARELARLITVWSQSLPTPDNCYIVCSGGGSGIMEAANRGASEAKGLNIGLTISIPLEEFDNRYVTRELSFHFHYFFMRKFWFAYLAKALLVFPGGFGTLDEVFEILTLRQTRKMGKPMVIVLFGTKYWDEVINFEALIRHGTINREDLQLFHRTDSVDEAYEIVTRQLMEHAFTERGPNL